MSVWRLPIFKLLEQLPEMKLHCIPQGLHGALSWKRTGVAALRCPRIGQSMKRWKTTYTPPPADFIGVDDAGNYKTAVLKEYPFMFSGGLAQTLADEIAKRHTRPPSDAATITPDRELHEWIARAAEALGQVRCDAEMRPDLV